jgi:hypothetical protein
MFELHFPSFLLGQAVMAGFVIAAAVIATARQRAVEREVEREIAERAWRRHAPK